MKLRTGVAAAVLLLAVPAQCQDHRPDDEVVMLRNHLRQLKGVAIGIGGINFTEALRVIADAVIDQEIRLRRLERQK